MYAAIIAGGSGTRLWPSSRKRMPKQFHCLYGENTLLQETVRRLEPITPRENYYVIANKSHESLSREQLPWLGEDNYIGEPFGKNTAPAVGMIATIINRIDPDGVILITPADHIIQKEEQFLKLLQAAEQMASEGPNVVTIGIRPTYPATGYGYIQMDDEKREIDGVEIHKALDFREKPDRDTAEEYVASWQYVWNSGMFIWSAKTILDLFRRHAPEIYELLMRYDAAIGTPDEDKVFDEVYNAFPSISVDYAIMEHAENIYVIPGAIGWSDLGSWASLYEIMDQDEHGNAVVGHHVGLDTYNCLIHSRERLVATVGLDNLVVVDTGDVVVILPRGRSEEVKELLDEVKKRDLGDCF